MRKLTLSEYNSIPKDYRGIWTVERWDLPNWAEIREKHMGKRTMMVYDKGTCLLVEGLGFEIVDDSAWKKADEVKKEIGSHFLKFYCEQGREPHYADCTIRWCDTLETEEVRIALAMDSDNEKDDEISVVIGSESPVRVMNNSSLVFKPVKRGDKTVGVIGVLGPLRMDYARVLETIERLCGMIGEMIDPGVSETPPALPGKQKDGESE